MLIYGFDTDWIVEKLLPPQLRTVMRMAWLRVLVSDIKSKYIDIYGVQSYYNGFSIAKWSSATAYVIGNRVRYGVSIYEALTDNTGLSPDINTSDWLLIEKDFVGADERVKYNGQKMVLEYILNRYLNTTATTIPTIYILNNPVDVNGFYMGIDGASELGELGTNTNQNDFLGTSYTLNQYCFTIYVPLALYTSLGTTAANRENRVRNVADKYIIAGVNYNVTTY